MPWATMPAAPMAVLAALTGRRTMAVVASAVTVAGAAMAAPLTRRRPQPPADSSRRPLTVVHANLLYDNAHVEAVGPALRPLAADVVTFSEYTPAHAVALRASTLADDYPHRIERPARHASGTALWSRFPIIERPTTRTRHHTVVADVDAPGGVVRVIVIHTQSPIDHHRQWVHDLEQLAALEVSGPAVMTGDFNAGWWHPEFRRLLDTNWRDAHLTVGRGLSCSWPTDQWHPVSAWHPPFVRLDHALVNDELVVGDVVDLDVPGSDHRGLMVTVTPAAPAAP
jgi:endonuclease/exonuclease/phosphatase (EEP) superfamily protein YafD